MVVNIFWNQTERRLRAFWRILLQFILVMLLMNLGLVLIQQLEIGLYGKIPDSMAVDPVGLTAIAVLNELTNTGMMVIAVWLGGRFLDRRKFADFGMAIDQAWWKDLGFGLALGAVLMTVIFAVEIAAGWVTINGYFTARHLPDGNFILGLIPKIILFLGVGFREEVWMRGYQILNINEGLSGLRWGKKGSLLFAAVINSVIFGLLHATNPNASLTSTLMIIAGGILLASGYVFTGRLAIPIGLHITWNFFQNAVYGFPVSGAKAFPAYFISTSQSGPEIFTGGAFGPEAGLVGLGAILLGFGLVFFWTRNSIPGGQP